MIGAGGAAARAEVRSHASLIDLKIQPPARSLCAIPFARLLDLIRQALRKELRVRRGFSAVLAIIVRVSDVHP